MKPISYDTDLRARFHELRDEVNASAPPFLATATPKTKRRPVRWALGTVGATAALALLLWTTVFRSGRPAESIIDLSLVAWTAPSDYLLETPGRDLLRSLPEIETTVVAPIPADPSSGIADTSS